MTFQVAHKNVLLTGDVTCYRVLSTLYELFSRFTTLSRFDNGLSDPSLGIHERKCSSEWSTKTIKRSGGTTEVVAGVMDYTDSGFFQMEFSSQTDIGSDNEIFSSHWREKAYVSAN